MVKQVMTPIGRNVDIEVLHICRSATSKALAKSAGKICTERPVAAVMTAVPLLKLPIKRVLPVGWDAIPAVSTLLMLGFPPALRGRF